MPLASVIHRDYNGSREEKQDRYIRGNTAPVPLPEFGPPGEDANIPRSRSKTRRTGLRLSPLRDNEGEEEKKGEGTGRTG